MDVLRWYDVTAEIQFQNQLAKRVSSSGRERFDFGDVTIWMTTGEHDCRCAHESHFTLNARIAHLLRRKRDAVLRIQ